MLAYTGYLVLLKSLHSGQVHRAQGCDICLLKQLRGEWDQKLVPQPHFFPSHPLLFNSRGFPSCCLHVGNRFIFLFTCISWCKLPGRQWGGLNSSGWRVGEKKERNKEEIKRNSCLNQKDGPDIQTAELNLGSCSKWRWGAEEVELVTSFENLLPSFS